MSPQKERDKLVDRNKIVIGTRGSKLALWQASYVSGLLKKQAQVDTEVKIIKTKGDKILDVALSKIADKGLFVKEIENELLAGDIDIAVHSMKDLPTDIPEGLKIAASSAREDHRDVLISLEYESLGELPKGAVVGTSSLRRKAQVLALRPDVVASEIRGNVDTRVKKLESGEYQAVIMAIAGLRRLGATDYIKQVFSEDEIMPAVGQGAIAIEARASDSTTLDILKKINDAKTLAEVKTERALMKELQGGCQVPIGAIAKIQDGALSLKALISSLDGTEIIRGTETGKADYAEEIGIRLARTLKKRGGKEILDKIRAENE